MEWHGWERKMVLTLPLSGEKFQIHLSIEIAVLISFLTKMLIFDIFFYFTPRRMLTTYMNHSKIGQHRFKTFHGTQVQ